MTNGMSRLVSIAVVACCVPLAWAGAEAARTVGVDMFGSMAWAHAVLAAGIATFAGAGATLDRWLRARRAHTEWSWPGEVGRDLFVSGTVGAGGYWLGSEHGLSSLQVGVVLLCAGWAGIHALDWAADKMFPGRRQPQGPQERDG